MYNLSQAALIRLNHFSDFLDTLHDISEQDMKMSRDITEENRYGQRLDALAWFWRLDDNLSGEDQLSPHMKECRFPVFPSA